MLGTLRTCIRFDASPLPAWIRVFSLLDAASITEIVSSAVLATYTVFPSGVNVSQSGVLPVSTRAIWRGGFCVPSQICAHKRLLKVLTRQQNSALSASGNPRQAGVVSASSKNPPRRQAARRTEPSPGCKALHHDR